MSGEAVGTAGQTADDEEKLDVKSDQHGSSARWWKRMIGLGISFANLS